MHYAWLNGLAVVNLSQESQRTVNYRLLIMLVTLPVAAYSRSPSGGGNSTFIVETMGHYGFIIPHSEELKYVSQSQPWGVQIGASKLFNSTTSWNNCNCYSKIGISFDYFNFNNPEVLGSASNLILFAEPLLGYRKRLFMSLRGGMGITYLSKVYDEDTTRPTCFSVHP